MKPDLSLLDDVVGPKVLAAMRDASAALTRLGIRHVVVGGLAVGANGAPRATKDVHSSSATRRSSSMMAVS